jgi:hypothetical protein
MRPSAFRILLAIAFALPAFADQLPAPPIRTSQIRLPLGTPAITPATIASFSRVGDGGPQTFFYWIVTNTLLGSSSPVGPFQVRGIPNTLSGSNFVQVNVLLPPGAVSIDLLRTTLPIMPGGACACAVVIGNTTGVLTDQSNALGAYTVAPFDVATLELTIANEVTGAGQSHLILRQNGVQIADLSSVATGLPCGTNMQVQFNDLGACGANAGFFFNKGTGLLTAGSLATSGAGGGSMTLGGAASGAITLNVPAVASGTFTFPNATINAVTGTAPTLATFAGSQTTNNLVSSDVNHNLQDTGISSASLTGKLTESGRQVTGCGGATCTATFSPAFSVTPNVVCSGEGGSCNISSISTTQVTFNVAGVAAVQWIAVGAP